MALAAAPRTVHRTPCPSRIDDALSRRHFLGAGAALLVAGCAATPTQQAPVPADPGYPRTVQGWQSSTTIPQRPERIVVLPYNELRALLSLGVAPTQINNVTEPLSPVLTNALAELRATPTLVPDQFPPGLESIAAHRPQLMIFDPDTAEALGENARKIGPVLAIAGSNRAGWQENVRMIAEALDLGERGRTVIADTERRLDALSALPFGGARTAALLYVPGDGTVLVFCDPACQGVQLLAAAGLTMPPELSGLAATPDTTQQIRSLSLERLDLLGGADVLFLFDYGGEARALLETPAMQAVPAVAAGRAVLLDDADVRSAFDSFGPIDTAVVERFLTDASARLDGR